uniref:Uncharacterized protein n=1 Tax=Alexandrium monilatum TaxID=311494 RepID=A0A7S4SYZ8_9DINO
MAQGAPADSLLVIPLLRAAVAAPPLLKPPMRSSLGLTAAYRARPATGSHGVGSFSWHGVRRATEPSDKGYERVVLPGTLSVGSRRAMRSLATAAGLKFEAWGPSSARRISLALQAECSCCMNALSFPSDAALEPGQLRAALVEAFGISRLSDDDVT